MTMSLLYPNVSPKDWISNCTYSKPVLTTFKWATTFHTQARVQGGGGPDPPAPADLNIFSTLTLVPRAGTFLHPSAYTRNFTIE